MKSIALMSHNPAYRRVGPGEPRQAALDETTAVDGTRRRLGALERTQAARTSRIAQVRAALCNDRYITSEKIDRVVERLLDQFKTWL